MIEKKLNNIKKDLIGYANHIEKMTEALLNGLEKNDTKSLKNLIKKEEPKSNEYELKLEKKITIFIARYQPRAKLLRTTLMIYKINADFERISDHIENIASSFIKLESMNKERIPHSILEIIHKSSVMFNLSIDAFISENVKKSQKILKKDNEIDRLKESNITEVTSAIKNKDMSIEKGIELIRISRNAERMADLTTNLAEDIIYIVKGKMVKHKK